LNSPGYDINFQEMILISKSELLLEIIKF